MRKMRKHTKCKIVLHLRAFINSSEISQLVRLSYNLNTTRNEPFHRPCNHYLCNENSQIIKKNVYKNLCWNSYTRVKKLQRNAFVLKNCSVSSTAVFGINLLKGV